MGIVVELVGRNGTVLSSQTFQSNTVKVGRAYDCDLILTDTHVDAEHLSICLDSNTQRLSCEDLSSLNGSWLVDPSKFQGLNKNKRMLRQVKAIFSGQALLLGKTYLRVYSSAHKVESTHPLSVWEDIGHFLGSYWLVAAMASLVVVLNVWNGYLNAPQTKKIFEYILSGLLPIILVICYAFFWAVIGKSIKHDGKFFTHACVGLFALLGLSLIQLFLPPIVYAFGLGGLESYMHKLLVVAVGYGCLSVTLIFASNLKRWPRNICASFIPLIFLIPFALDFLTRSDFQGRPGYDRSLARPVWSLRKAVDSSEFIGFAQNVYQEPNFDKEIKK